MTSPVAPSILRDHVLKAGRAGPQEFAGLAVERVDDAGFAGDAGEDFAAFAGLELGIDPGDLRGVGGDGGVDQDAFEGMVEIPVIDDVLVIPDDLAGVGIDGQRAVVIQILFVVAGQQEFRGG